jgi:hypothetical protein
MFEVFEEVFEEVMEMFGLSGWWKLFDSDKFSVVEDKLVERFGESVLESEEFLSWVGEMAADL